ncbi:MAG: DUF6716 putative glycosyltransferase [Rhodoglobus sp.]
MKVLGIADSDSYAKWGASILDRMPQEWATSLVVIRTPALPSAPQLHAALSGTRWGEETVPLVDLADLAAMVARERPDVVLLSVRGPVVRVLIRMIVSASPHRPVIVGGLPGISIPATLLALYYRSQLDVFILHSKREIAAFDELASRWGIRQDFALARLPYLNQHSQSGSPRRDIVFAAQAKVPRDLLDRERLLSWLLATAREQPMHRVVLKLRGAQGEAQTHAERFPYGEILGGIEDVPANLVVSTGPMSGHLEHAVALVTVSSTAALEAVAMGVPVLALDDFGVSPSLINLVFEGSGLLGDSQALITGDYRHPDPLWLDKNYFHQPVEENWIAAIEAGVRRRQCGPLPLRPQFRGTLGGNLRRIWDRKRALGHYDRTSSGYFALAVGLPLLRVVRTARKLRGVLRMRWRVTVAASYVEKTTTRTE